MDSAGPSEIRTAGQPTVSSGTTTFGFQDHSKAETFARNRGYPRVGGAAGPAGGYRASYHPSATGDRHLA